MYIRTICTPSKCTYFRYSKFFIESLFWLGVVIGGQGASMNKMDKSPIVRDLMFLIKEIGNKLVNKNSFICL